MSEYIEREDARSALLDCVVINIPGFGRGVLLPSEALKRLNLVPIADVAPVRHETWKVWRRWRRIPAEWYCSGCGGRCHFKPDFSPACGAKMDGKKEGGDEV